MSDLNETSVGKTLSTARKKKRLRYKKLSSELNIDESYLTALEENKFDLIPGGEAYVKGFLRAYAKKLDLNPDEIIENYLSGNVKAWGVLQNRSGKVTRQFSADLDGKWDGKQLILDEKFNWDDGEVQTRQWQITKIDDNNYEGTAGDVVGKARGYSYGPAFKFEYVLLVPVKGKEIKITFDDWIFKQDDRVAINRASMTKFGIKVAELTVVFVKD